MKILIVTNLYPPQYQGGYEIRCAQTAEALRALGHEVRVLTSTYGLPVDRRGRAERPVKDLNGVRVHRVLNQYVFVPQPTGRPWTLVQARRELSDMREFAHMVRGFGPDVVSWWSMYGLSKTLLPLAPAWGIPDVHWIEHPWMVVDAGAPEEFWASVWDGGWGPAAVRPVLRWLGHVWERRTARAGYPTRVFPSRPQHVCYVSEYMRRLHRDAGLEFPSTEVIHGGVPVAPFYEPVAMRRYGPGALRVLYAGQLSSDRGLHTVIEALGQLDRAVRDQVSLSVAGVGSPEYLTAMRQRVDELRLGERVTFLGRIPHDQMPVLYKANDVLVFPSIRDEGLPLSMVEAMLAGCAVLTTGSGGAMEIAEAANLPLFPKEDSAALARLLADFVARPEHLARTAAHGQDVALREFTFDHMMERWESTLRRLAQRPSAATERHAGGRAPVGVLKPGTV